MVLINWQNYQSVVEWNSFQNKESFNVRGVKGQLGFDVVNELEKRGHTAIGVDVDTMDITNSEQVENVIKANMPEAVIHCAAYTAVDLAEDNKELCDLVFLIHLQHQSLVVPLLL